VDGYLGMLAVLKARAAYVPLDPGYPPDRLAYIAADAGIRMVLSRSHLAERVEPLAGTATLLYLDQAIEQIAGQSWDRLGAGEAGEPADDLCYIIYTSGSTGGRKGSRSSTPASATSSGWRPRCTGCAPGIASTRA
jgi:non-ribosomal peptide synthetase component F